MEGCYIWISTHPIKAGPTLGVVDYNYNRNHKIYVHATENVSPVHCVLCQEHSYAETELILLVITQQVTVATDIDNTDLITRNRMDIGQQQAKQP